ncbi:MAG TPA: molybdate ABC transporter substrate-binding protein [Thermoleophilaceae bacterium]|nr:molybdate ABC transporter substrate-binding protein [Thermoleophilaceae bacterium]
MKRALLTLVLLAAAVLPGCGGDSSSSNDHPALVVSAASSLRNAFADYAQQVQDAKVRLSFGGSDELAAQVRGGSPIDVFAAANAKLPDQLHQEGKVEKPVKFTGNRLVLAVPKDSQRVNQLSDLVKPGVKIGIGAPDVPIGTYTREVLSGLPAIGRNRILANVKSQEPDVAGIVGKLTQGAVDAGFVYVTDVDAASDKLRAINLPAKISPTVVYEAAVVKGTKHPQQAKAFIDGLTAGKGQGALRKAGFLPPPQ